MRPSDQDAIDQRAFGHLAQASKTDDIMQFFQYAHLPVPLRNVSREFATMAMSMVHHLPRSPERTVALRKLLETKDAAVRAFVWVDPKTIPEPQKTEDDGA